MWHALVQRRYTETAGALAMSLIYCLVALVDRHPPRPDDRAGLTTEQPALHRLPLRQRPAASRPAATQARRGAADQLFALLIHTPWVALNFGGTEHCIRTDTGDRDHDPISLARPPPQPRPRAGRPAAPPTAHRPARSRPPRKACVENTSRYPGHFLRYAPGSDDRDAEYQALNDADPTQLPDSDPGKTDGSYRPAVVDKPVTDAMEKGGQDQRLLLSLVILAGELGALMLLGALSVSVLLSQVIVLLLACFAPVALVAAVVPGRGHDAFKAWAARLASYLVRKAAYSLVLAVILAVLSALQDATSNLGWLMSFGLQALLLWTVYLQRHALTAQLISTVTGHQPERDAQLRRLLGLRYASPDDRARRPPPTRRGITPTVQTTPTDPTAPSDEHAGPASPPIAAGAPPAPDSVAQPAAEPVVDRDRQPRRVPRDRPVTERDASHDLRAHRTHRGRHEDRAGTAGDTRARVAGAPDDQPGQPAPPARAPTPTRAPTLTQQPRTLGAVTATTDHPPPSRRPRPRSRARRTGPSQRHHPPSHRPPVEPAPTERSLADELRADQPRA